MANEEYWRGYKDAIKHVDATLKAKGDDRSIRICRQAVLALVKVPYDPGHVMPEPDWSKLGVDMILKAMKDWIRLHKIDPEGETVPDLLDNFLNDWCKSKRTMMDGD